SPGSRRSDALRPGTQRGSRPVRRSQPPRRSPSGVEGVGEPESIASDRAPDGDVTGPNKGQQQRVETVGTSRGDAPGRFAARYATGRSQWDRLRDGYVTKLDSFRHLSRTERGLCELRGML